MKTINLINFYMVYGIWQMINKTNIKGQIYFNKISYQNIKGNFAHKMPMLCLNDMLYWLFMFSYKMFKQVPKVLRYQVPSYPGIQTGTLGTQLPGSKYPGTRTGTQALLPFIDSDIIHGMCILMIHYMYRWTISLFKICFATKKEHA